MTKPADLSDYLFAGLLMTQSDAALSAELTQWMEASVRFTSFVETYRDKIRKKIRVTREPESLLDLRAELEVACRLLNDRRLAVTYEPYASAKQRDAGNRRGADFAVTYRANLVFNVEVGRMRAEDGGAGLARKVERILLAKLGQMQPGMSNLLVIYTRPELAQVIDLGGLLQALKTRVDGKDPAFFAPGRRYASPADFYKDFNHLSGLLLWTSGDAAAGGALWVNRQARPVLDEKVIRLVSRLASGEAGEEAEGLGSQA